MPTMTNVIRVRRETAPVMTRAQVKPGQVFSIKKRDGSWSKTKYACLDNNGRFYSLRITPEGDMLLAATDNGGSSVKLTGKWELKATILRNGARSTTTRSRVTDGQLYAVKGGKKTYAHVGKLNSGKFFSLVLNSDNHATTRNANSRVTIVGDYTIDVTDVA